MVPQGMTFIGNPGYNLPREPRVQASYTTPCITFLGNVGGKLPMEHQGITFLRNTWDITFLEKPSV